MFRWCGMEAVRPGCDLADSLRLGVRRYGESVPLLLVNRSNWQRNPAGLQAIARKILAELGPAPQLSPSNDARRGAGAGRRGVIASWDPTRYSGPRQRWDWPSYRYRPSEAARPRPPEAAAQAYRGRG